MPFLPINWWVSLKGLLIRLRPYVLHICLGIFIVFLLRSAFQREHEDFYDKMKKMQDAHDETIKKIVASNEEERKAHEANLKRLEETLDVIQRKHEQDIRSLEASKSKQVKQIVSTFEQDPTAAAKQISEATGLQLILPEVIK